MRAWQVQRLGEPRDVLRLVEIAPPLPGPGEVVIEVEAAALNFFDSLLCQGRYQERPPLPFTLGSEVAGRIVAAGAGAAGRVGERVLAMPAQPCGGLAERIAVPAGGALPIPEAMAFETAAALHISYQTAHFALHRRARLQPGETVLVHAGAGGVGSASIQLAAAGRARVMATAGGPEKVALCRRLGAEIAIDYRREDFVAAVRSATGGRGADVIVDPVGGDVFDASRRCIAFEGRLIVVGFTSGRIPELPVGHALVKNYSVDGLHWGLYAKMMPDLVRQTHDELVRLYSAGKIAPLVSQVVPFDDVPAALDSLATRGTVGKLVTRPGA